MCVTAKPTLLPTTVLFVSLLLLWLFFIQHLLHPHPSEIHAQAVPLEKGVKKESMRHREVEGHCKVTQWLAEPELEPKLTWIQTTALLSQGRRILPNRSLQVPCVGHSAAPGAHWALVLSGGGFLAEAGAAVVRRSRPSAESAM